MVFTLFCAWGVYQVRDYPHYAFALALAAHAQVLVGMTGLSWVLGRRMDITIKEGEISIDDTHTVEGSVKI